MKFEPFTPAPDTRLLIQLVDVETLAEAKKRVMELYGRLAVEQCVIVGGTMKPPCGYYDSKGRYYPWRPSNVGVRVFVPRSLRI